MSLEVKLEDIFSSKGAVRVLKVLSRYGEANITAVHRECGVNYRFLKRYVEKLKKYGILKEKRFGRVRILVWNDECKKARLIRSFIQSWRNYSQQNF